MKLFAKAQFFIFFSLVSTKLFSQVQEDVTFEPVTDPVLSIEMAEKLIRLSRAEVISFFERNDYRPRTYDQMKRQDSTLTREKVHFPDGKQKKFYLQNDVPLTICIEVDKDDVIQSLSWDELKKFFDKYSYQLRHSNYERVKCERVGCFHYKSEEKKKELLIEVNDNNDLTFTFWGSN